jgi:hypothetical protein
MHAARTAAWTLNSCRPARLRRTLFRFPPLSAPFRLGLIFSAVGESPTLPRAANGYQMSVLYLKPTKLKFDFFLHFWIGAPTRLVCHGFLCGVAEHRLQISIWGFRTYSPWRFGSRWVDALLSAKSSSSAAWLPPGHLVRACGKLVVSKQIRVRCFGSLDDKPFGWNAWFLQRLFIWSTSLCSHRFAVNCLVELGYWELTYAVLGYARVLLS